MPHVMFVSCVNVHGEGKPAALICTGSEVWKYEVPHALSQCRVITDGEL